MITISTDVEVSRCVLSDDDTVLLDSDALPILLDEDVRMVLVDACMRRGIAVRVSYLPSLPTGLDNDRQI